MCLRVRQLSNPLAEMVGIRRIAICGTLLFVCGCVASLWSSHAHGPRSSCGHRNALVGSAIRTPRLAVPDSPSTGPASARERPASPSLRDQFLALSASDPYGYARWVALAASAEAEIREQVCSVGAVREVLGEPNPRMRVIACLLLGTMTRTPDLGQLLRDLASGDPSPGVRCAALIALAMDSSPQHRTAVDLLSLFPAAAAESSLPLWRAMLGSHPLFSGSSSDECVTRRTRNRERGRSHEEDGVWSSFLTGDPFATQLRSLDDPRDIETVSRAALHAEDEDVRTTAIRVLGRTNGSPDARSALERIACSRTDPLRGIVIDIITRGEEGESLEALTGLCSDPSPDVVSSAIDRLGRTRTSQARAILRTIYLQPTVATRRTEVLPFLADDLSEENSAFFERVYFMAISISERSQVLRNWPLRKVGGSSVDRVDLYLCDALASGVVDLQLAAIDRATKSQDARARSALAQLAETATDQGVRQAAARAARCLKGPR